MNKRLRHIITAAFLLAGFTAGAQTPHVTVGGNVYGGGKNAKVTDNATVTVNQSGATLNGDVYGGGALADVNTTDGTNVTNANCTTSVTLTAGTVSGSVYGGGLGRKASTDVEAKDANVFGAVTVTVNGGTVNTRTVGTETVGGHVFGCNNQKGTPKGTVTVNFESGSIAGNVYGGGNEADATATPVVNINGGSITKSVFGGGNLAGVAGNTVNINAGTIGASELNNTYGIYGGCKTSGTVTGDIVVNILGGTLGTSTKSLKGIFGGGYGDATRTNGNVNVNFGRLGTDAKAPTVYGDIYGGSALGQVNDAATDKTTVNILNGYVKEATVSSVNYGGNIYGGGLGETGTTAAILAKGQVNGVVEVNIGANDGNGLAAIDGNVYGCNNTNGSPKNNVAVNVYSTAHGNDAASNKYPDAPSGGWTAATLGTNKAIQKFAIDAVYGGGNLASYTPAASCSTTVHVYNCDNTIEDIYGGGKAANVGVENGTSANTIVIIDGGRIHRVFGGGNGEGTTSGANIYGMATTTINAGLIDTIFGGSNYLGSITATSLNLDHATGTGACTDEMFGEVFGGANVAPITGNLATTINCGVGDIGYVYGGSNRANITGDVTLNIKGGDIYNVFAGSKGTTNTPANINGATTLNLFGGVIDSAFGGSNINGNITGKITVNMLNEGGTCPLSVDNIYGAGCLTAYTPTADNATGSNYSPEVNIFHGTVSQHVYGGALGASAKVTSNPHVRVGYADGMTVPGHTLPDSPVATVTGNVFGGGELAAVQGNPKVTVQHDASTVDTVFGGGAFATTTNTTVDILGGTVSGDVYGGGAFANAGNTTVNIIGGIVTHDIFGGGLGGGTYQPTVGTVHVNIGGTKPGTGSAVDTIGNATIGGNVYGCNNSKGSPTGSVYVDVYKTAHRQSASPAYNDNLAGTDFAIANVFGGGKNAAYTPTSTGQSSNVYIHNCYNTIESVFGGADAASSGTATYPVNVNTTIDGGRIHYVFGGGNGMVSAADINGNVSLTMHGGNVGAFFVGSNKTGAISGNSTVNSDNSKCGFAVDEFFCGGNYAPIQGDVITTISCSKDMHVGSLYGGCNMADIGGSVVLNVYGGTYTNVFGGSKGANPPANANDHQTDSVKSDIGGSVTLNLYGGTIENVYGGSNINGNINGTINVNMIDLGGTCALSVNNIYGGGLNAEYSPTFGSGETERISPIVNIIHGKVSKKADGSGGNVFGGGKGLTAVVTSSPKVNIGYVDAMSSLIPASPQSGTVPTTYIDTVEGNIYGGGDSASVTGNTSVIVQNSNTVVGGDVYGGGNEAIIRGSSSVDINGGLIAQDVYGGGNAADVWTSDVDITGGKIRYVFGGGHGDNSANHNKAAGVIGNGTAIPGNVDIDITGGTIEKVFAGCNVNGAITGSSTIDVNKSTAQGAPNMIIGEVYGGGNYANSNAGTISIGYTGNLTNKHSQKPDSIGVTIEGIGTVYGGANQADIGTSSTTSDITVNINNGIVGNVFGGNNTSGSIYGNIVVNVEDNVTANKNFYVGNVYGGGNLAAYTAPGTTPGNYPKVNIKSGTISGDVYGGGKGSLDDVSTKGKVTGNPEVYIGSDNASYTVDVKGNVFGGGENAIVDGSTTVNIQKGTVENTIYGGGKGVSSHEQSGLVMGNTSVTMTDGYVVNGIFGGGLSGSVGTFTRSADSANIFGHTTHTGCMGKPIACADGTGKCTISVTGGQIGPVTVATQGMPVAEGWVWGGSCGSIEDPATHPDIHFTAYVGSTDVTIGGTAFIMEGVIGGGEFGRVLGNTLVKIQDHCQIGVGFGQTETVSNVLKPKRYTDGYDYGNGATTNQFIDPTTTPVTESNALAECAHFVYGRDTDNDGVNDEYLPYDPYFDQFNSPELLAPASTNNSSLGDTWIGVVFGGGSGYMPYIKDNNTGYDWCRSAGWVEGNAEVRISGGHILTNVYGGNEYTDVKGISTVTMTGGTIGVPRTSAQKQAFPLFGNLYGAGKGDGRTFFNTFTNVDSTVVSVSGGIIYGSVYGGGEDGHVLRNTSVTISGSAKIGSTGTSYYDGNVFGGGRGFAAEALTAGVVKGNVDVKIIGGTILGSIYGGGQLASVGTYLADKNSNEYGKFIDGDDHGFIKVTVSGGTIGNDSPYTYFSGNTNPAGLEKYIYDANHVLEHSISGNVYGGCMGRVEKLNGSVNMLWPNFAVSKKTRVTVTNGTIKGSVYGGGELGTVRDSCTVNILGGTIGSVVADNNMPTDISAAKKYNYGSVYGGGYGSKDTVKTAGLIYKGVELPTTGVPNNLPPAEIAGRVYGNTYVNINGGTIKENVFGGGDVASVGQRNYNNSIDASGYYVDGTGTCTVVFTNGTVGPLDYTGMNGYVYAAGKGVGNDPGNSYKNYCNVGNANVTVSGGKIWGSIFGGGADCHVLGNTSVEVHEGANIGTRGVTSYDGNIFGGGRNYLHRNMTTGRVAGNTTVTMDGGAIKGSVFGGGRLGLTGIGVNGTMLADVIDGTDTTKHGYTNVIITGGTIGTDHADSLLTSDCSIGDVYAAGKGLKGIPEGARVKNSTVKISQAAGKTTTVYGNVFGGGEQASVGYRNSDGSYKENSGVCRVTVSGGTIGTPKEYAIFRQPFYGNNPWTETATVNGDTKITKTCTGNVNGGGMGDVETNQPHWISMAQSRETHVTITDNARILGVVYGGAEQGMVHGNTEVIVTGGIIGQDTLHSSAGNVYTFGGVYGGGYGSKIATSHETDSSTTTDSRLYAGRTYGNTRVVIDSVAGKKAPVIYGDVYGGASLATVKGNAEISLRGGRVSNNVYGGSRGQKNGTNGETVDVAANIGGKVTVNIGDSTEHRSGTSVSYSYSGQASIGGDVYGGNNTNGSANGNTFVNIFSTKHGVIDSAFTWQNEIPENATYAIANVFGGGNEAADAAEGKQTRVALFGCENTVQRVFGGGNAAASRNVFTVIEGGRYDYVYGGGNGERGPQYAANILGNDSLAIHGGRVNHFFVGSNANGEISGRANVVVDHNGPCGSFDVDEFFCGGNYVDYYGDINFTVSCASNMAVKRLYGGCKQATMHGNITLNVQGGHFEYVYGGSEGRLADPANNNDQIDAVVLGSVTLNLNGGTIDSAAFGGSHLIGSIRDGITVNVMDTSTGCPLTVHNVYGGGNLAPYTAPTSGNYPQVNILKGTVSKKANGRGGNVFGGGYGAAAVVNGNPVVTIGDNAAGHGDYKAIIAGDVYGGGDSTGVTGSTTVTIHKDNNDIYGDVYGGSNKWGTVSGNTAVTITGGKVGTTNNSTTGGKVFGGGNGANTEVTGKANVDISGNTTITNDVFGGGNEGEVKNGAEVKIH